MRVSGKPAPAALNRAMMPLATPSPPMTMPSTVAVTEMMSASATIRRRTCFVLAPTARISASSRRRWLIVMPNTLLMMNALTKVVMKANASRPLPKIEMNELMSSAASSATCWPVTTSVRGGRMSSIAAVTVAGSAPSASLMSIASYVSPAPSTCRAVSGSNIASVAPPKPSALPRPTSPTIVNDSVPESNTMSMSSPTS